LKYQHVDNIHIDKVKVIEGETTRGVTITKELVKGAYG
jgi:hypothetical protein